jgi:hypothetical protein
MPFVFLTPLPMRKGFHDAIFLTSDRVVNPSATPSSIDQFISGLPVNWSLTLIPQTGHTERTPHPTMELIGVPIFHRDHGSFPVLADFGAVPGSVDAPHPASRPAGCTIRAIVSAHPCAPALIFRSAFIRQGNSRVGEGRYICYRRMCSRVFETSVS